MSNDLVTILVLHREFEANILAIVLRDHGIDAFVFANPGFTDTYMSPMSGVPLQVKRCDVEFARKVLRENEERKTDIELEDFESGDEGYSDFPKPMPIPARIAFFFVVLALMSMVLLAILNA